MKKSKEVYSGIFRAVRDFGFAECEKFPEDVFIGYENMRNAWEGDEITFEIIASSKGKRKEGRVIEITNRATSKVVGTFVRSKNYGFVIADNRKMPDIFVPKEKALGAVTDSKVVVKLDTYGGAGLKPEGEIIEILGHRDDPGVDILSIVKAFDIPCEFPEKVLKQAEKAYKDVSEADMFGRDDLRDVSMVTIDGEDSKDLDDAVSLVKEKGIYHLGVHIADVSNYVQESSALDKEAVSRGTSTYLVDRVIPMLPHALCNGICSLNEGEDRLSLSCLMDIDESGKVVDYRICESVINVNRRMTYNVVSSLLDEDCKDSSLSSEYSEFVPMFKDMADLADILRARRKKRGSIDFDLPETKIHVDENGKVTDILPYDRNIATRIIEEFMLIANETVAEHFFFLEIPFVYRTHETPDADKMQRLSLFIKSFGLHLKMTNGEIHPKEIQKLIAKVAGTSEEMMVSRFALRSMKRAKYSELCLGHFGLAAEYYCHFTSPIRRYPDLQIHRIIKDVLRGRMTDRKAEHYNEILHTVSEECSRLERRSEEAEREVNKLKKAEYMKEHIGETYEGFISGLTAWGVYVELQNTVEGMIHISKLPGDNFFFDEKSMEIVGGRTGRKYRLGDKMNIIVSSVDVAEKTIDFDLI